MVMLQLPGQWSNQLLSDAFGVDPAHIKGILMGQGVEVEQLQRHRSGELLRRLEQAHQQDRPQKIVDHAITDTQLFEQGLGADGVVAPEHLLIAVEISHRIEQTGDAQAIGNGETSEIAQSGEHLTQGTGQGQGVSEDRSGGFQAIGRPEGAGGECREHLGQIQLCAEGIDVGVILPEPTGARLKGLATGGGHRRAAAWISQSIDQGDSDTGLSQCLGGTPSSPASADHHDVE